MNINEKRPRSGQGIEGAKKSRTDDLPLSCTTPAANLDSPRLWSVFRRYARNHRRISRLVAENEVLLERLRQIQGVPL